MVFAEAAQLLFAKKKVAKSARDAIYKDGFYLSVGIFGGIGLNDLFRLSMSDTNYKQVPVAGKEAAMIEPMHLDEFYQYAIVAGITLLSALTDYHFKEILPASAGALLGISWSNSMERKGAAPISIIPA